MTRTLGFKFQAWTGVEAVYALLPEKIQAVIVAKRLLKGPYRELDPKVTPFVIQMARGAYRIVDRSGKVEPTDERAPEVIP